MKKTKKFIMLLRILCDIASAQHVDVYGFNTRKMIATYEMKTRPRITNSFAIEDQQNHHHSPYRYIVTSLNYYHRLQ